VPSIKNVNPKELQVCFAKARSRVPVLATSLAGLVAALGTASARADGIKRILAQGVAMPAYWVARSKINDPVAYKKYTDRVPGIIAKFGGKVLARGGRFQILEGPQKFHRFVVIEFPTLEQAVACHGSAEYVEASAFRKADAAGEVELVIVESGDATVM
jgi:uncharacterized protein (DUF1330 family)